MLVYDYVTTDVVEVTDSQYDFLQALIKSHGAMDAALKEVPVTAEQMDAWKGDPVFWPVVQGHLQVLHRSRGLTPEYLKSYLLGTLDGTKRPTGEQLKAIGHSLRALGMGLAPRQGFGGKATITGETTIIEFNDGLDNGQNPNS